MGARTRVGTYVQERRHGINLSFIFMGHANAEEGEAL